MAAEPVPWWLVAPQRLMMWSAVQLLEGGELPSQGQGGGGGGGDNAAPVAAIVGALCAVLLLAVVLAALLFIRRRRKSAAGGPEDKGAAAGPYGAGPGGSVPHSYTGSQYGTQTAQSGLDGSVQVRWLLRLRVLCARHRRRSHRAVCLEVVLMMC